MDIQRIAAFSDGDVGGNPAGVVLLHEAMSAQEMQHTAAQVGYSETAFAFALDSAQKSWRVRYFSPESEVAFCGHATIALGAVLTQKVGPGSYKLELNAASISVEGSKGDGRFFASLSSPPTSSRDILATELRDALKLLGLSRADLDERIPPARIHGGSDHLVFALRERKRLSALAYDLDEGREMMNRHGLGTIMLVWIKDDQNFAVRNAFASGGVLEDPATGAAAAAFAGYLRDRSWRHNGAIQIVQGEDMGSRSIIDVRLTDEPGASVQVSGAARPIESVS